MAVIVFTGECVVAALPAPENLTAPLLSGQSIEPGRSGDVLEVTTGDWSNGPETFTYAWYRRDTIAGSKTTIGTESTFTLTDTQLTKYIGCDVTATNDTGSATAQSNQIGPVADQVPIPTALPEITGTLQVGETLTVSDGTWDNSPSDYDYQWHTRPSVLSLSKTNIGANQDTFVLTSSEVGLYIGCDVTATNSGGSLTAEAAVVGPITAAGVAPANTVLPSISGTVAAGQTLTIANGTWDGNPAPSYTYQWDKSGTITVNGSAVTVSAVNVTGGKDNMGTASTQALTAVEVGSTIGCTVTATNTLGSATAETDRTASVTGTVTYSDTYLAPMLSEETGTDSISHTFTDFPVGDADANRVITFWVIMQGTATAINTVTVNGSTSGVVKHEELPGNNSAVKMAVCSKALASGATADIVVNFQIPTRRCAILGYAHTRGTSPTFVSDSTYTTGTGVLTGTITVPSNGALMACACASSASALNWAFSYNGTAFATENYDATIMNTIKTGLARHTTAGTNQTINAVSSVAGATPARLIALAFGARS